MIEGIGIIDVVMNTGICNGVMEQEGLKQEVNMETGLSMNGASSISMNIAIIIKNL